MDMSGRRRLLVAAAAALVWTCICGSAQAALYSKGDGVVELNDKNFDALVTQADGVAVVEFYAPCVGLSGSAQSSASRMHPTSCF
jgi:hypothetical protein